MKELTFVSPYEPIHVFAIEKHPVVMLKPTFEVEVAKPEMLSPDSVVVPNPVEEIVMLGVVVVAKVVGEVEPM